MLSPWVLHYIQSTDNVRKGFFLNTSQTGCRSVIISVSCIKAHVWMMNGLLHNKSKTEFADAL